MVVRETGVFADGVHLEPAVFRRNVVDVHGTVTTLSRDILIERVPCNTLHIMTVLGNLVHALA
jgi:hypothetical protein